MKKYLQVIITFVCLTSCITNKNAKLNGGTSSKFMVGAYADFRDITNEEMKIFDSAYTHKVKLTPKRVSTQVVAGTNYQFICTDNSDRVFRVVIFKPLPNQGEPKVTSIEPLRQYENIPKR